METYRGHALSAKILDEAIASGEIIGLRVGRVDEPQVLVLPIEWLPVVQEHHGKPEEIFELKTGTGQDGLCKSNLERVIEGDDGATMLLLGSPFGLLGRYGLIRRAAVAVKASEFWMKRVKEGVE